MCSTPALLALCRLQAEWVPRMHVMPTMTAAMPGGQQLLWWCGTVARAAALGGRSVVALSPGDLGQKSADEA